MNILIVVPWDQPFGGVASVVGNLAKSLTDRGHRVSFFHPVGTNRLQERTTEWGFRGFAMNLRAPRADRGIGSLIAFACFLPATLYQLYRLLRRQKIQIVNIHYPGDDFIYFALCRLALNIRLVTSVHGADFFPGGQPRKISRSTRLLLAMSDAVVAPSRAFLRDLVRILPEVEDRARAIHNGLDLDEFTPVPQPERTDQYVLCIAQHNVKKGVDVLINAFSRIKDTHRSLSLVLVGDGPLRPSFEALAATLGVQERVQFVGWKGRADIANLLHGCQAFVLASRSEPFGIVVIEAMACRKPVLATSVGGIVEIVDDHRNGILVPPDDETALADGLALLLGSPALRKTLGDQAYTTVQQRFTYQQMGQNYEVLFAGLLEQNGQATGVAGAVKQEVL